MRRGKETTLTDPTKSTFAGLMERLLADPIETSRLKDPIEGTVTHLVKGGAYAHTYTHTCREGKPTVYVYEYGSDSTDINRLISH
jgi:hypothetical protein